jgi:hypothetical protein
LDNYHITHDFHLQVHFLPIFLTRPSSILRLHRVVLPTVLHACRSATFLSTFVSSCWYGVCLTRSIFLARLFPWISHDIWDGPYGSMMAGSLLCGSSIWIENGRRRGEMALYVLPRAIRSLLPYKWMKHGNSSIKLIERLVPSKLPNYNPRILMWFCFLQYCVCRISSLPSNSCCTSPRLSSRPLSLDIWICHERSERRLLETSEDHGSNTHCSNSSHIHSALEPCLNL